jgi:hypothetical protein
MRISLPVCIEEAHVVMVLVEFVVFENAYHYAKSNDGGKQWHVSKEEVSDSCNT